MAKQQSFADKAKKKEKSKFITVKYVKTYKTEEGNYKFKERFVKLDDINKVADLK